MAFAYDMDGSEVYSDIVDDDFISLDSLEDSNSESNIISKDKSNNFDSSIDEDSNVASIGIDTRYLDSNNKSDITNLKSEFIVDSGDFEDLVNVVKNANSGDVIKVSGKYTFTRALNITADNLVIIGSEGTLFDLNKVDHASIEVKVNHFNISGINFINGYKSSQYGSAISITLDNPDEKFIYIGNCNFDNCTAAAGTAISLHSAPSTIENNPSINAIIENCNFSNMVITDVVGGVIYGYSANVTVNNCSFVDNGANKYCFGGAIGLHMGSALIKDCYFKNNFAMYGGAISGQGCSELDIINCYFVNNSASNFGGAIYKINQSNVFKVSGNLTLINSTFVGNNAPYGGAICDADGVSENVIDSCKFVNNSGRYGGAFMQYCEGSEYKVINSSFTNNSAKSYGGVYFAFKGVNKISFDDCEFFNNSAGEYGGVLGISTNNAPLLIVNKCLFVDNFAEYVAPAILMFNGILYMENSTLENNHVDDNYLGAVYVVSKDYIGSVENNFWGNYTTIYPFDNEGGDLILYESEDEDVYQYIPKQWVVMNITGPSIFVPGSTDEYNVTWHYVTKNGENVVVNPESLPDGVMNDYVAIVNNITKVSFPNGVVNYTWTEDDKKYVGVYSIYTGNLLADLNLKTIIVNGSNVSGKPGSTVSIPIDVNYDDGAPVKDLNITVTLPDGSSKNVTVVDGKVNVTWTIPEDYVVSQYPVNITYNAPNGPVLLNKSFVEVLPLDTFVSGVDVCAKPGSVVTIDVVVVDEIGNFVRDGDGDVVVVLPDGSDVTVAVVNGSCSVDWAVPVDFGYLGSADYNGSFNVSNVEVKFPFVYLDLVSNDHYTVNTGEIITSKYALSNNGTDIAYNVTVEFKIPKGLKFISASVDKCTYSYDSKKGILKWFVNELLVNELLNIEFKFKATESGNFVIIPSLDCEYASVCNGDITIKVNKKSDGNESIENNTEGNTSILTNNNKYLSSDILSENIAMKNTGLPILGLILCLLSLCIIKRKN